MLWWPWGVPSPPPARWDWFGRGRGAAPGRWWCGHGFVVCRSCVDGDAGVIGGASGCGGPWIPRGPSRTCSIVVRGAVEHRAPWVLVVDVGVIGALRCLPGPCARVCLALMSLAPAHSRGGGAAWRWEVGMDGCGVGRGPGSGSDTPRVCWRCSSQVGAMCRRSGREIVPALQGDAAWLVVKEHSGAPLWFVVCEVVRRGANRSPSSG